MSEIEQPWCVSCSLVYSAAEAEGVCQGGSPEGDPPHRWVLDATPARVVAEALLAACEQYTLVHFVGGGEHICCVECQRTDERGPLKHSPTCAIGELLASAKEAPDAR